MWQRVQVLVRDSHIYSHGGVRQDGRTHGDKQGYALRGMCAMRARHIMRVRKWWATPGLLRGVERWQTTQRKTTAAAIKGNPRIAAMTTIVPSVCRGARATRTTTVARTPDVPVPGRVEGLRVVVDGARRAAHADPARHGCTTSGAVVQMAPLVLYAGAGCARLTCTA
jgi:hypothetical protein